MRRLRYKSVSMSVHPDFHRKINDKRKEFYQKTGVDISNTDLTGMLAKIKIPFPTVGGDLYAATNRKKGRRF